MLLNSVAAAVPAQVEKKYFCSLPKTFLKRSPPLWT